MNCVIFQSVNLSPFVHKRHKVKTQICATKQHRTKPSATNIGTFSMFEHYKILQKHAVMFKYIDDVILESDAA